MPSKSILVFFTKKLPKKSKKWYEQFDEIIGPDQFKKLVGPGSIHQAFELANKLPRLTSADGRTLPKTINHQGYELWWMHYDSIYAKFCIPYTQYAGLLSYLKDFENIYLFQPPWPHLFRYFLEAYGRRCFILNPFHLRKLLPISLGNFIQIILSIAFLPWLLLSRPKLMVFVGDKFDPLHDYDFRYEFIYKELRERKIRFVEFLRSLESSPVTLQHAWKRKRPVVYSAAIILFVYFLANLFGKKKLAEPQVFASPEEHFWFLAATHYVRDTRGVIWSIGIMRFILRLIGVKAAIIPSACDRNFHEVLGCKTGGIKTLGVQHGATPKHFFISDFMPGFDGEKSLSLDIYGLWSEEWKKYYLKHSRTYGPEQLYVAGLMRPLKRAESSSIDSMVGKGHPRILFISEQWADPLEIMPYLSAFLSVKDFDLYLKFRPYRDGFEEWLKEYRPETLKQVKILRGSMQETVSRSDIVVGSHSTAVLEALLCLKPFIFFWTDRWGDYFGAKNFDSQGLFFAANPQELVEKIRKTINVSKDNLRKLQERFFGDPYKNGSKWVVNQAEKFL